LVRLVAGRSKLEKQQIRENYKAMYGEEMTILFQKMQAQMGSKERAALWHTWTWYAIVAREAFGQADAN